MKTKTIMIIFAVVLAAAFALGAAGIVAIGSGGEAQSAGIDRLIGVLVTDERTDPFGDEAFLEESIGSGINAEQPDSFRGRVYGRMVDRVDYADDGTPIHSKEYVFDNIPGVFFYCALIDDDSGMPYHASSSDEGIADSSINFNESDDGEETTCACTVLVSEDSGIELSANPVYCTPSGEIYAVPGGAVISSSGASSVTVSFDDVYTVQSGIERRTESFKVSVTAKVVPSPERIRVSFMDEQDGILLSAEYAPAAVPESMETPAGTDYIIVASRVGDTTVRRDVFSRESEYINTDEPRGDGFVIRRMTEIIWK